MTPEGDEVLSLPEGVEVFRYVVLHCMYAHLALICAALCYLDITARFEILQIYLEGTT